MPHYLLFFTFFSPAYSLNHRQALLALLSAKEAVLVDSLEDILKQFSEGIDNRLNVLTREHEKQLQNLMHLKANLRRRAKRVELYQEFGTSQ